MNRPNNLKAFALPIMLAALFACSHPKGSQLELHIIPEPEQLQINEGHFVLNRKTTIEYELSDPSAAYHAGYLDQMLQQGLQLNLKHNKKVPSSSIRLSIDKGFVNTNPEAYTLLVSKNQIIITAGTEAGLFYGIQTFFQLLPSQIYGQKKSGLIRILIPCVEIKDQPQFAWRGAMLDVSRHKMPKEFIFDFIDMLAYHKLNTFHWHLTDGIGWRIQIDQYPKLTEWGAYRKVFENHKPWEKFELWKEGDTAKVYGGFYSKEDILEILDYASQRQIQVIPEIEMPGHSMAALDCYPKLRCENTGQTNVYCAGKEESFQFLQNVLTEIIELFPSDYIHIGGDEVEKEHWEQCALCQNRMKEEGLKDEKELQSYFISRIAAFLKLHDKKLIGWDEILEGGLEENATVMCWRGTAGGIQAANMGHDVIFSPNSHWYFDHYQGKHTDEPQAWGGYSDIKHTYSFDPIPEEIKPINRQFVLGGQANLWTEHIAESKQAEYMLVPRMAALAEVLWSPKDKREWFYFAKRMHTQFKRYDMLGYNYAESSFTPALDLEYLKETQEMQLTLENEIGIYPIHYTTDGSAPNLESKKYTAPILISERTDLKARTFRNGSPVGFLLDAPGLFSQTSFQTVKYLKAYSQAYDGGGDKALIDSKTAYARGDDEHWQGFEKENMEVIIDFGETKNLSSIKARFFQRIGRTSVLLPRKIEFYVSFDGIEFELVQIFEQEDIKEEEAIIKEYQAKFPERQVSFIKIIAENHGILPQWHPWSGGNAWLFCDEIRVE